MSYIKLPIDGSGGGSLSELSDVDISAPNDNDVLTYNSTSGKWEAQAPGASSYPSVATWADLPSAATHLNDIYFVEQSTGVWLINRHSLGFYISNGTTWLIAPEVEGYAPLAGATFTGSISATNLSGTNTGDETNATIKTKLGQATTTTDGWLDSTDFSTFNNKPENISELLDVDITLPQINQSLVWSGTQWTNDVPYITPAGANHEVQLNLSDVLSSSPNFRFDPDTNTLEIGQPTLSLPSNPINIAATLDLYLQVNMQNKSSGLHASSDFVVTADNGNDTINYGDFGINSSTYSLAGLGAFLPNDVYSYSFGNDYVLGTGVAGKKIKFIAGGTDTDNIVATLDESVGLNLKSGLRFQINSVNVPIASEVLPNTAFSGLSKITVSNTQPVAPSIGDLWIDTN